MQAKQIGFEVRKECFWIASIWLIVFVRFCKTILLGKYVSKIFLTAHWDSLFYPLHAADCIQVDCATIQLYLPNIFFVANCWRQGIPLWNEFSGFGRPLLADPQAFVLSPLFALFYLLPNMQVWNLTLILELAIGATFTYLLCRELEIRAIGAFISALLFTFCPYAQWNLELLGNGYCLTPLVFLFFAKAAKQSSFLRTATAGAAAALDIYCAHPEIAFVTISFSSIFFVLTAYFKNNKSFNYLATIRQIFLIGLVAFGLSAPQLFPFLEFLSNCKTYKFSGAAQADVSLQALIANFLFPFYSTGSLFLGPLSWWGISALFCISNNRNRFLPPLIICLSISILTLARVFPLDLLFKVPPLSLVLANYFFPTYLLLISSVSGLGIDLLLNDLLNGMGKRALIATMSGLFVCLIPAINGAWHHNCANLHFEYTFESPHFEWPQWFSITAYTVGMWLTLILIAKKHKRLKQFSIIGFACLGILNLILVAIPALPIRPTFHYPRTLPVDIITSNYARFLSLGDHLLRPNVNLIYQAPTVRDFNPLFPKGYGEFLGACGASDEYFQIFQSSVKRIVDLTATRTIISEQPLIDENRLSSSSKNMPADSTIFAARYSDLLSISRVELYRDLKARAIICRFSVRPGLKSVDCHLHCDIKDKDGKSVSYIEPQYISRVAGEQLITLSGFIPEHVNDWTLWVSLTSDRDSSLIQLTSARFGIPGSNATWFLGRSDQHDLFKEVQNDRFVPISRFGGSVTAYENKTALNRYFFVKGIKWVKQRKDALTYLTARDSQLDKIAVLDETDRTRFENYLSQQNLRNLSFQFEPFDQSGSVKRLDRNPSQFKIGSSVDLEVNSRNAAFLVASDIYYPGWKVFLDGAESPMFQADYLFRGVLVPEGKHQIRFTYLPTSFILGVLVFLITSGALFALRIFSSSHERLDDEHDWNCLPKQNSA